MPQNELVDIQEFLKFTSAGLKVASFVDIRASIIDRYKQAYGTDIDVSTGTADGVFINDLALIINNILQSVKTVYANLDVNTASGIYLDNLCALANVYRKQETASTASIEVTNSSNNVKEYTTSDGSIIFVDQAGTEWIYNITKNISFAIGETKTLEVVCQVKGPVSAPAGWIVQTISEEGLTVVQKTDASLGQTLETDAELKARRAQSSGSAGTSVLESLTSSLLNISGIEDVKIYNNDTDSTMTAKDTTSISAHSIYLVLRKASGITIDDSIIGSIIYEKMTPGIKTVASSGTIAKEFTYIPTILGSRVEVASDKCYWKDAQGVHPEIKVTITPISTFNLNAEKDSILESMVSYFNGLLIGNDITSNDCIVQASYADPQSGGRSTYIPVSATVNGVTSYTNPDSYYDYKVDKSTIALSGSNYIITLKGE